MVVPQFAVSKVHNLHLTEPGDQPDDRIQVVLTIVPNLDNRTPLPIFITLYNPLEPLDLSNDFGLKDVGIRGNGLGGTHGEFLLANEDWVFGRSDRCLERRRQRFKPRWKRRGRGARRLYRCGWRSH